MSKVSKQFYDTNVFVVQPCKGETVYKWSILNPGGVELARIIQTPETLLARFWRKVNFSASYSANIVIEDLNGNPLMGFKKPFSFGYFTVRAKDQERRLGSIVEEKQGLDGRRYMMYDDNGRHYGQLEGDWNSYSLQLKDAKGASIGKISRKSENVNKLIFTEKSAYYVVHLYIDQQDLVWRRFLLGTSAAIGLLLR